MHRDQPERCAAAVRAFRAQGVPVDITIVDNGSPPPVLADLARKVPRADVLSLGHNQGFGPAANAGLRRWLAEGASEWVVVAPHDALPQSECLLRMLEALDERPRAGLASAEYGEPRKPVVDPYFGGILVSREREDGWEAAGHPHGTLMFLRRGCLEDIGLFDERYFAYGEEADLALRARGAGWEVGIVWGAIVHNPSLSVASPVVEYLQLRNSLLLIRDHFGRYHVTIRIAFAVAQTLRLLVRPRRRSPWFCARARWMGVRDFAFRRFGPPPPYLAR